eukprot:15053671-Heterocapsa_arctica.AAC.1
MASETTAGRTSLFATQLARGSAFAQSGTWAISEMAAAKGVLSRRRPPAKAERPALSVTVAP